MIGANRYKKILWELGSMKFFKKIVYGLYAKNIYINLLDYIIKNQKEENNRYLNNYSLILKPHLIQLHRYKDNKIDEAKERLINSGYIGVSNKTILYVTDDGENFFQDYYRFSLLGWFGKLTNHAGSGLAIIQ